MPVCRSDGERSMSSRLSLDGVVCVCTDANEVVADCSIVG